MENKQYTYNEFMQAANDCGLQSSNIDVLGFNRSAVHRAASRNGGIVPVKFVYALAGYVALHDTDTQQLSQHKDDAVIKARLQQLQNVDTAQSQSD